MNKLLIVLIAAILLVGCVEQSTPEPTLEPTPRPILYLIIKPDQRAPVYTDWYSYIQLSQTLHAGDTVPVRESKNWEGFMWYDCLVGHLDQFPAGATGWVKFKEEKMYLEWRQP